MALVYGVKVNVPSNLIYVDSVGFCFSRYWRTSNLTGYDNRRIFSGDIGRLLKYALFAWQKEGRNSSPRSI